MDYIGHAPMNYLTEDIYHDYVCSFTWSYTIKGESDKIIYESLHDSHEKLAIMYTSWKINLASSSLFNYFAKEIIRRANSLFINFCIFLSILKLLIEEQ